MVRRGSTLLVLAAALAWTATAGAARFSADVDRKELLANEHVLLTLSLVNSETRLRAQGVKPNIDLTVLSDQFELGVPRADFRFNIERNRGRATSELTVELFPRHTGRLVIPAFSVDGLRTEPIELKVLPPPGGRTPEVFARSGVSKQVLWVREQALVYLDLYHRVDLAGAKLGGALDIEPPRVELHELPQTDRAEEIDGLRYNVTRTAWALAPREAGPVAIHLPDIWVETRDGQRRRLPFRDEGIEARALPPDVPANIPVGRPQWEQSVPAKAITGRLVPWEVKLAAPTALNALPETLPVAGLPPRLKSYTDPAERRIEILPDGTPASTVVYRMHLMPEAPGTYRLPALELPFFDTGRGRMALATLPAQELHVEPAPPSTLGPDALAGSQMTEGETAAGPSRGRMADTLWQGAAGLLFVLWLATAILAWRLYARRPAEGSRTVAPSARTGNGNTPRERLLAALGARTLEQGLAEWEQRHGDDPELHAAVRLVQRQCYGRDSENADELNAAVDRAVRRLRGTPSRRAGGETPADPWSPRAFYQAVRSSK